MTELKIPDAAYDVMTNASSESGGLRKAAPLIVAAELRRLTDHIFSASRHPMAMHELFADIAQSYLKRADELDPQGVTK